MSIAIDKNKCIKCGKCVEVCPGSLIYKDEDNKAFIKYEDQCWGCTACLKECAVGAIKYYLGKDIGGEGAYLYVKQQDEYLDWHIVDKKDKETLVRINKRHSNKY